MGRFLGVLSVLAVVFPSWGQAAAGEPLFHDAHFHLTNYVQEGPTAAAFLETMGSAVGRSRAGSTGSC